MVLKKYSSFDIISLNLKILILLEFELFVSNVLFYNEFTQNNDAEGAYFDDYCNWQRISQFEKFVFESPAAQIAAKLMQSDVRTYLLLVKFLNYFNRDGISLKFNFPWYRVLYSIMNTF